MGGDRQAIKRNAKSQHIKRIGIERHISKDVPRLKEAGGSVYPFGGSHNSCGKDEERRLFAGCNVFKLHFKQKLHFK